LPDNLKLYEQAAARREYPQACQYAYEIAAHYRQVNDPLKSLEYLNLALSHARKSGDQTKVYSVSHHLGIGYLETKKYSKALENFQSALSIVQKLNNGILIREELMNVSISYGHLEKYKKAIEFSEEALSLAITSNDVLSRQKCYQLLADYYESASDQRAGATYPIGRPRKRSHASEVIGTGTTTSTEQHLFTAGSAVA
jgi:tetratricopeptide (TPR) repeat protein